MLQSEIFRRAVQIFFGLSIFDAPLLLSIRHLCYNLLFKIGRHSVISQHVYFIRPHGIVKNDLVIGNNVRINSHVEIDYSGGVIIEDNVWISQRVIIETHGHDISSKILKSEQSLRRSHLILKNDCWLGANCFISERVEYIGQGAVIGANSVVTKNVPDWAIVAGNPAQLVRYRK